MDSHKQLISDFEQSNPAKKTYKLKDLMKQKKHLKPAHRDLKRVYDGMKHTDNFLKSGLKEKQHVAKGKNDVHKNKCWDFEEAYSKTGKHIRDNYYRKFDS